MKTLVAIFCVVLTSSMMAQTEQEKRDIANLINELAVTEKTVDLNPWAELNKTLSSEEKAALIKRIYSVVGKITKYEDKAFSQLMASFGDQRQSISIARYEPGSVGNACYQIIIEQLYSLPARYNVSITRIGRDGETHSRPVYSKCLFEGDGVKKWLRERKGKHIVILKIEALSWVLAKERKIGFRNENERRLYIAPLEARLKELKKQAEQVAASDR